MKYLRKLSFTILAILLISQLVGCGKDDEPENTALVQWDITIDGTNYSYEGTYTEAGDLTGCPGIFQTNAGIPEGGGQVLLVSDDNLFTIQIASVDLTTTGSHVFDSDSEGLISIMHGMNAYTSDEGSVTVNITSFPSLVWGVTDDLEATMAKGDFSGTVIDAFDSPHTISGSFDAIRVQ
ncbi:hypothetical protein N8017_04260 [Crocinitomicaceae bacterium]|nr:hypothetical protein [Crocinitomicaceae bacterium]MDC1245273.1 hypothetical protein [Crocinitomicaceae bacterium]